MRSRSRRPRGSHGACIACLDGLLPRAAAPLHQLQRILPELQLLLACHGVALGAPPALSRERPAAPAAALPAAPSGHRCLLPESCCSSPRGFCVRRHAACAWRLSSAASFYRGGGSLAPRRSKEAPKTGDHGGIMRQLQRNRSIPTLPNLCYTGVGFDV